MELFGDCGRRDTARVVSLLLLLFSLASWILELSIDVFPVSNPAYSQTLPPPIFKWSASNSTQTSWHVLSLTELPEYEEDWWNLPNVFATKGKSRYYVEEYKNYVWSEPQDRYIDGDITVASWPPNGKQHSNWSPDDKPDLVYGKSDTVMVEGITCSSGGKGANLTNDFVPVTLKNATDDIEEWGTVLECDQGPARIDVIGKSKPSIISPRATRETHT
ncbi:hypothetical protein Esi_0219_0031 [Ectocarpus siliculosus]|uniref:Uncharacterized protein n=1 Tax=Ectocarpus siliculosus TaxID=2880 RepID=D7FRT8_ECTSI|nr:hypothetical protein Esi_0219_0031 [Ectocarpus siliculosus]|eukprot:CBJ30879.1 hypothetical protein Esi_0219_0031 [Ectocarpus siliculosus]